MADMDVRRAAFRLTEIFDYRTFAVAGVFGALVIVGYFVFSSAQTARSSADTAQAALAAQQASGQRASRRIDGLQRIVAAQAQQIADSSVEQAQLRAGQEALARQVQQMGGQPIVSPPPERRVYVVMSPQPESSRSTAASPSPHPSPSRTSRPSPSPTCRPLPIIGCVGR